MDWVSSCKSSGLNVLRGWKGLGLILERGICCADPFFSSNAFLGIRASKPRPSAFLVMMYHLLRQIKISLGSRRADVVKNDRLPVGRRLGQLNVAGNNRLINLFTKKFADFISHLGRQTGPAVHRQKRPFDF